MYDKRFFNLNISCEINDDNGCRLLINFRTSSNISKEEKLIQLQNEFLAKTQSNLGMANLKSLGISEREYLLQVNGTQKMAPDSYFKSVRRSADAIDSKLFALMSTEAFKVPNYDSLYMLKSDKFLKSFFKSESKLKSDLKKWVPSKCMTVSLENKLPAQLFDTKASNRAKTELRPNNSLKAISSDLNEQDPSARYETT